MLGKLGTNFISEIHWHMLAKNTSSNIYCIQIADLNTQIQKAIKGLPNSHVKGI